jgi:hypothetical protein
MPFSLAIEKEIRQIYKWRYQFEFYQAIPRKDREEK